MRFDVLVLKHLCRQVTQPSVLHITQLELYALQMYRNVELEYYFHGQSAHELVVDVIHSGRLQL